MLRIAKLTDYGVAVATRIAARESGAVCTVRSLAESTGLPPTTVSKVCKLLCKGGVLVSQRGVKGGYRLSRPAAKISVADIVESIEGRLGVTECMRAQTPCELENRCTLQNHWRQIDSGISNLLGGISLQALTQSKPTTELLAAGDLGQR